MSNWQASLAEGVAGFLGDLAKAGSSSLEPAADAPAGDDRRVFGPAARAPDSLLFDPYSWYSGNQEFLQRPLSLDWNTLRRMSAAPPISAIIKRRCEDAEEFCHPEENPYLPGFKVRMRNRKAAPSRAALRMIDELERFVLQGGVVEDMRQIQTRDSFPTFVKKVVRDSLVYDQLCFEVVPSRLSRMGGGFRPARFVAAPAHTMRIANTMQGDGHALPDDDFETARYVQVYEEVVVNEYRPSEMCFAIRNPRTDLEFCGYGYSELEMLVTIVTAWLNAFEYNRRFFSQGAGIPGILNLKGQVVNEKIMRAFKRELQMLVTGASNAHRLPVTTAEGMEFINLHSTNREMEYSAWMDLLTKLACALFSMDPSEIGFNFGNAGQSSSMGTANQVEKIAESRERGLKPLVRFLFAQLNRFVIWQIDPDFEIVAQGLRQNSEADDLDLDIKRLNAFMTVDQIRARSDMPPMEDGKGACILNPTWLQFSQAAAAQGASDGGDGPPPMDTDDLFGPPDQPQPPAQPPQSVGTPPIGVVQQTSQPAALAASMTARKPRVSSFTL